MGGVDPDLLVSLQNRGYDPTLHQRYDDHFLQRLHREYIFKIQAKSETYRDETRIRYRVFGVDPLTGVIASDMPTGLNGIATCHANLVREGQRILDRIYEKIPKVAAV